jgi:hypothetical protein
LQPVWATARSQKRGLSRPLSLRQLARFSRSRQNRAVRLTGAIIDKPLANRVARKFLVHVALENTE